MPDLVIAGASTRAAAFSALRAGFRPHCLDRYADADLRVVAEVTPVSNYPEGVVDALRALPPMPVMYGGALENAGTVLDSIESTGRLLGNPREIVQAVRDPLALVQTLREFNLPHLEVRPGSDPPQSDSGAWVAKPLAGAAGRGIVRWTPEASPPREPHYFQRWTEGESYSAVFVAPADRRDVRFVGITRQIIGDPRLGGGPFTWCGSVGPETLSVEVEQLVRRIGNILSWKIGLTGLFGFDFLIDPEGTPLITEVNPRYTGSIEVLEHTLRLNLVSDHCAVFGVEPSAAACAPDGVPAMGRFILYSDREFEAPDPADWLLPDEWLHGEIWRHTPRLADVPCAGTRIGRGQPICSIFVTGESGLECLERLNERLIEVRRRLGLTAQPLENGEVRA